MQNRWNRQKPTNTDVLHAIFVGISLLKSFHKLKDPKSVSYRISVCTCLFISDLNEHKNAPNFWTRQSLDHKHFWSAWVFLKEKTNWMGIQEELDNSALDNLLGKQSSISEKASLQSLSLPQSGAWLSAAPIPALGLLLSFNDFCVALQYLLGVKLYENERICPFLVYLGF